MGVEKKAQSRMNVLQQYQDRCLQRGEWRMNVGERGTI